MLNENKCIKHTDNLDYIKAYHMKEPQHLKS